MAVIRLGESFQFRRDESNWWTVKTASGTVGFVHSSRITTPAKTNPVWIFTDSSLRRLSLQDLEGLSANELWRARNEIFARKGLIFQTDRGRRLAQSFGNDYSPLSADQQIISDCMNPVERHNITLIEAAENALGRP